MTTTPSARRRPSLSRSPRHSPLTGLWARNWMDDMFDQFLADSGKGLMSDMMDTAMDVSETDQAFEVKMDLPGVRGEDVDIQIENNTLTVRGQRLEEKEEKDAERQFHRLERISGSFARSVVLPASINEDETAAEFANGVLKIVIPKMENAKPKKIRIGGRPA